MPFNTDLAITLYSSILAPIDLLVRIAPFPMIIHFLQLRLEEQEKNSRKTTFL